MALRAGSSWSSLCLVSGWLVGCGSSPSATASMSTPERDAGDRTSATSGSDASALGPDGPQGGGTSDASGDDVTSFVPPLPPVTDGAAAVLWLADAAPLRASDCKPGTYSGTFAMMVAFAGVSALKLTGNLSITLVANKPSAQFGEFNGGILTVAPGAMFAAKDNLGDELFADISGQLDCGTRMFVGTLSNGGYYVFGNDAATGMLDGTMSATYDPGASPPDLGNGTFTFASPQVPLTMGTGTWSAALQ